MADISSMNPAIGIKSIFGLLRLLIVSFKTIISTVADFASGHWVPVFVLVFARVSHFGDINKFNVARWERSSNMASVWVSSPRD